MKFIKLDKRYKGHGWGYNYAFELRKREKLVLLISDILESMHGSMRIYSEGEGIRYYSWARNENWFSAPVDGKRVRIYLKNEYDATMIIMQLSTI